ncbi:hypothetical protein ABFW00_19090 [Mycobacteroides abscessus]|uniref:hypothetical protein n=1 Tax=Mycobacteroides abscessus TaxID=36809 RepID=UPI0034CE209E
MWQRFTMMQPELLPTMGLAELYLAMSPIRTANQCTLACGTMIKVLQGWGLDAEAVAAYIDAPDGRGGVVRYGREDEPRLEDGLVSGHVVLVADDVFVDATASQFPAIVSHGGVRVLGMHIGNGGRTQMLQRGAIIPTRLAHGAGDYMVQYTVRPSTSADRVMTEYFEQKGAAQDLAALSNNLSLVFAKTLAELGLPRELSSPRYAALVAQVEAMRDMDLIADENKVMHAVPRHTE